MYQMVYMEMQNGFAWLQAFVSMFYGQVVAKISCAGWQFRPLKCRQARATSPQVGAQSRSGMKGQCGSGKAQSFARPFSRSCQGSRFAWNVMDLPLDYLPCNLFPLWSHELAIVSVLQILLTFSSLFFSGTETLSICCVFLGGAELLKLL